MKTASILTVMMIAVCSVFISPVVSHASSNSNVTYYSDVLSCKDRTGYSNPGQLSVSDPILGMKIANIELSNYSSVIKKDGETYFLKTSPDIPELSINILENLEDLGVSGAKVISDSDTRIADFGYIGKIGYGLLLISHRDSHNEERVYAIPDVFNRLDELDSLYTYFGQEGEYRISLFYEVRWVSGREKDWIHPFKYKWVDIYAYGNYRIDAHFHIRNANAMLFLFDSNGNEVANGDMVSRFTLDLASSKFLNVSVKREVAIEDNRLGETSDVKFNSVGVDKRTYTTPGIYTITATCPVTGSSTTKRLIVEESGTESAELLAELAEDKYPSDFRSVGKPQSANRTNTISEGSEESNTPNVLLVLLGGGFSVGVIGGIIWTIVERRRDG